MRATVAQLSDSLRLMVGYHFGWWDRHGQPATGPASKGIRPALVLLSAKATSTPTPTSASVAAAVAVELLHNFSLLHDDVMDDDATRHHRPTVWSVIGSPHSSNSVRLVDDVVTALRGLRPVTVSEHRTTTETIHFTLPMAVRSS